MKFKLNLVTLALATVLVPSAAMAGGYGLQNANTDKVKLDKWVCKNCKIESGFSGTVGAGVAFADDDDDIYSANAFATENDVAGKVDADVSYINESGYRSTIEADNFGMDDSRLEISTGRIGKYKIDVNYRQIMTYDTDNALTPYSGDSHLTLPNNWQTAGSTDGMSGDFHDVKLSLKRKRAGIGFEYIGDSLWSTYVNYQREEKTGNKVASGSFFNQSMMLAEPVDYSTDTVEAGVKLRGENWFTALNYSGSFFKNDNSQLTYDNAFIPTFGAQTQGVMALDPDNEAHTVSLLGQYTAGNTIMSGRVHYGQMTQDESFITSGYGYQLPTESLDGQVDMTGVNLKVVSRLNRTVRLNASYDYNDRDNKTDVEQWTQISINNTTGQVAYNTPYDITTHRAKLGADFNLARGMKLETGYDYRRDERSNQDREDTDENTLWSKFRFSALDNWDMWIKGSYGERDGSKYEASQWTSSQSNDLLRKYNLADRKRTMVEARVSHTPIDALTVDFGARYALDDYNDTEIGLTESKDVSYDINVNYMINDDMSVNAFYNRQDIDSEQSGSTNLSTANWYGNIEDDIDVVGVGFSYDNLLEKKLRLGVDYTYSNSSSDTQVSQGITGDYGDYSAEIHNVNLYGQYQFSEKLALRFDYKLEKYEDNDLANSLAVDSIPNVLSFGDNNHDYTAQLVMFSVSYKL